MIITRHVACVLLFFLSCGIYSRNDCVAFAFSSPIKRTHPSPLRHAWALHYAPSSPSDSDNSSSPNNDSNDTTANNNNSNNKNAFNTECAIDDEDCNALSQMNFSTSFENNTDEECDYNDEDCKALQHVSLLASLRAREVEIESQKVKLLAEQTRYNWFHASCIKSVGVTLSDWVRKVAIDAYPIAVCGSRKGSVFVSDLEQGSVLSHALEAHDPNQEVVKGGVRVFSIFYKGEMLDHGPMAVAIQGNLIVSSGREGGVKFWKMGDMADRTKEDGSQELEALGNIPGLNKVLVTSLKFDQKGQLWVGCSDGTIRVYSFNNNDDDYTPTRLFTGYFQDSILDMYLCDEIGIGVCATLDGFAALFSLEDGEFIQSCGLFDRGVAARSVLVTNDGVVVDTANDSTTTTNMESRWSVVCGGMNGAIHRLRLNVDQSTGKVDYNNPFHVHEDTPTQINPSHEGPVVSLVSPTNGLFISGSSSGNFRVWDCSYGDVSNVESSSSSESSEEEEESDSLPNSLYDLTGENSCLISACTDGSRLISVGCLAPTLIVHDFTAD